MSIYWYIVSLTFIQCFWTNDQDSIVLHFAGAKMISGLSSSMLVFLMFGTYSMPSGVVFYLCLLSGRQSLGYGAVGSFEVTLYSILNNCPTPCTDTINNNVNNSIVSIVIFIRAGLIWRPGQIFTEHRQLIKFLSMRFGIYSFIFNQGLIHWFIFRSFRSTLLIPITSTINHQWKENDSFRNLYSFDHNRSYVLHHH